MNSQGRRLLSGLPLLIILPHRLLLGCGTECAGLSVCVQTPAAAGRGGEKWGSSYLLWITRRSQGLYSPAWRIMRWTEAYAWCRMQRSACASSLQCPAARSGSLQLALHRLSPCRAGGRKERQREGIPNPRSEISFLPPLQLEEPVPASCGP